MSSVSGLSDLWLRGVAANSGAPSDVLLRLLQPQGRVAWQVLCQERGLPGDVVDAVVVHPERAVRRFFARNRHVGAAQRSRLVDDRDGFVRAGLAAGPRPRVGRVEALPDDVVERLLTGRGPVGGDASVTVDEIRQELVSSGQISPFFLRRMWAHPDPLVRGFAAARWLWLGDEERDALLSDPVPAVRDAARRHSRVLDPVAMAAELPEDSCHHRTLLLNNYAVSRAVAEACLDRGRDLLSLATNPFTPPDVVARLARQADPRVRERVAGRADIGPVLLQALAEDPDDRVRTRARVQPASRTWAQCRAVDRVCGQAAEDIGVVGEMVVEPDGEWYRACALSGLPLLRRVAATWHRLPVPLVRRLADDPDPQVRHLLALNHPLAPPDALLDAFVQMPRQRAYLLTLDRLPRTGLRQLLGHADPGVRALAAGDPALSPPPVALLRDADAGVRRAAAAHPALPGEVVEALFWDAATAEGAAANPGLGAGRLHRLLDRAGLASS
ncbi:hypothetical protein ACF1AY_18670 [Streptomyces sp. NPDC014776]|uniref:hypothetical protein n=1 Tax=Streptomyces sp. NPDC014776 TaxID=3364909 RepID=UPI003702C776